MPDLRDGEAFDMPGSANQPFVLKNIGGVYSCSCPAWRYQSPPIERRNRKHLRRLTVETNGRRHATTPGWLRSICKRPNRRETRLRPYRRFLHGSVALGSGMELATERKRLVRPLSAGRFSRVCAMTIRSLREFAHE